MGFRFGLGADNAEIIDVRQKGEITVIDVQAIGVTKRAAKRGARKEAADLIPIVEQEFINVTKLGESTFNKKYLFTISDNGE